MFGAATARLGIVAAVLLLGALAFIPILGALVWSLVVAIGWLRAGRRQI